MPVSATSTINHLEKVRAAGVGDVDLGLEVDAGALEGDGIGVGDVIADDVDLRLVDVHPREARIQRVGQ